MAYTIRNIISTARVPRWGNMHKYIAIHYLGVDGQNNQIAPDGCGAHFYIYWDGTIYQRAAYDAILYAVGTAGVYKQKHPKAMNSNTISIELCCHCDGNKSSANDPKWWFTEATQKAAVWLVQKLMRELNIPIENVLRHYDIVNKVCPAPYVHNNKYRGTWTWQEFLARVKGETVTEKWYRVRKTWADKASQLGAYEVLENAKKNCPAGYSVFDENGKAIYAPVDAVTSPQVSKYPSGVPKSEEAYIEAVGAICKELQKETGILASVVAAQCCLETGFGLDPSCKLLMNVNNLLGMKKDLINNTWEQYTVWKGQTVTKPTPEYVNGKKVEVMGQFRAYPDYYACIYDYEQFLLHVRNSKGYKYSSIKGVTDPAAVIRKIRIGTGTPSKPEGYCTDPDYEPKILKLIKDYNLDRFNIQPVDKYLVARTLNDDHAIGKYHDLNRAKEQADRTWGHKVWDITTKKCVYEPKLNARQKFVVAMVYMDLVVTDEIESGTIWRYKNKNTKTLPKTFEDALKGNRYINCVSGVQLALLYAKVVGSDRSAIQWYGNKGIVWLNDHAEKDARKYFEIIDAGGKTVSQCLKDGTIQYGDIVTYRTLAHTNAYIGNDMWFDTGHANCSEKGEGAKFTGWTCKTPYKNYKVAQILRLK